MSPSIASQAESVVGNWLISKGCLILKRNYRCVGSELDIAAWTGVGLIIVEVKLRTAQSKMLDYASLLPKRKKLSLIKGAKHLLSRLDRYPEWIRFDLAIVQNPGLYLYDYVPGVISYEELDSYGY